MKEILDQFSNVIGFEKRSNFTKELNCHYEHSKNPLTGTCMFS